MGNYHTERYRRDNPWRANDDDNRRDDDEDKRGSRWIGQEDWQPETSGDSWDEARRRQRLAPGQLSDGGPAPSGYREGHHQERHHGSDLRYGLNGGYGVSAEADEDWRARQQYQSRQYASEYGDYGDFGSNEDNRWRQGRRSDTSGQGNHGFGNADQAWLREAERREAQYRPNSYFNDLRSDTRYWTEPRDEWGDRRGESRRPQYAQSYGREYLGSRGYDEEPGYTPPRRWSSSDTAWRDDDHREDYRGQHEEEHGVLYNLGHRIGQAVSDWFGPDAVERRAGPRGYTRTDERIRDEICERLTFATGVDVHEVTVDVDAGKVTLGGTVRMRSQKYDIEDIADNTFGVTDVENNIRVQRQEVDAAVSGAGGFNGS